jgi:transcriptional regulator GlxA family with amidase domain
VPAPFALVVPGSGIPSLGAMGNERLVSYLRFAAHSAEEVAWVSTGAFVLAAAGLLDGRMATTHPAYSELPEKLVVNYVRDYAVEDGKFLTMEGVSSAIDATLRLVAKLGGEAAAKRAEMIIEYDPQPPFWALRPYARLELAPRADGDLPTNFVFYPFCEVRPQDLRSLRLLPAHDVPVGG